MDKEKELYIGLDVGTDSVGFAATDQDFNLYRLKGKTVWGSRIFEQASDAKDRRIKRANRRRSSRRKYRIHLLNELFASLIDKIDDTFFLRLKESTYHLEDRSNKNPYLFLDKKKEKEYYKDYPTIWHLRNAQYKNEKKAFSDIRYVYLAIHHIIKYRGNFLREGDISTSKFDEKTFDRLNDFFKRLDDSLSDNEQSSDFQLISFKNYNSFKEILDSKEKNKTDKQKEIKSLLTSNEQLKEWINMFVSLITGGSFSLSKLDLDDKKKIQFNSSFDEELPNYESIFSENFEIITIAKEIYDFYELKDLLNNHENISDAFVTIYDSHKRDLKALKELCKDIDKHFNHTKKEERVYSLIFKSKVENNYNNLTNANDDFSSRLTDIHSFNTFILKTMEKYNDYLFDNTIWKELKEKAEKDSLLSYIAMKSTSIIPHQLHRNELLKIIDNASKFYPELSKIKGKLEKLFMFRVPYYYGPLNDKSKYSSVVRLSNSKVYPWNVEKIIDDEASKNKFIDNRVNKCRYLFGESVMPKSSITYQKYILLDRLNTISINGARISQDIKLDLLKNLILTQNNTTVNQIKNFLVKKYEVYSKDNVSISGINPSDNFINSSYYLFTHVYNIDILNNKQISEADEIIKILTIYKDNINDGIKIVSEKYKFNDKQLSLLRTGQFREWASFSKKLIAELPYYDENDVKHTIICEMEDTTKNFQEVLNDKSLNFLSAIDSFNKKIIGTKTSDELISDIIDNTPPKMRRSTIQAVRIIDEIVKVSNKTPKYISIEVTREKDDKKKGKETISRLKELKQFMTIFEKEKELVDQTKKVKEELNNIEAKNEISKLKGKHLYLYFKQDGYDLYTGEKINIEEVLDSTKYDTDHIIPKRLAKDDSLDNLVLVNRDYNQTIKGGKYPIPSQIQNDQKVRQIWKILHNKGAISDKKYNNLIRTTPLTDDEISDFVNAQINVVNQSNTTIRDILKIKYPDTKLIFSKAQYPSFIRKEFDIPKLRELNDTHHAVDAYLNIVSGVILHKKYSSEFWRGNQNEQDNINMENTIKNTLEKDNNIIRDLVKTTCDKHNFLLTYRNNYQDDQFYKQTIYKRGDGKLAPIHTSYPMNDTDKYGGYSSVSTEYFVVGTFKKKNKETKSLVSIPHLYNCLYKDKSKLLDVLNKDLCSNDEKLEIKFEDKINNNQKVEINGLQYLLNSSNENTIKLKPISPIFLNNDYLIYLTKAEKYMDDLKANNDESYTITTDKNKMNSFKFSKNKNSEILEKLIDISKKKKYDYCSMITRIRNFDIGIVFNNKTLGEQIQFIFSTISLFTRNTSKYTFEETKMTNFLKSKTFISENDSKIYLIYDSVTGLFTYKKKL